MKSILVLIFLTPIFLFSQENNATNDTIVKNPDIEAVFPGGGDAMMKYIAKNVKYPESALKNHEQGKVFVEFVVNADGSISNAKILRGATKELDKESLRVVNAMPNWTPAKFNGNDVKSICRVPINYVLDVKSDKPEE